ncbi:MAG: uroporphyrinogen decarboxylase family protein [Desulfobacteraceae bacterium]|jgi:uroporphyrinogen decarboxylase|nr:uroporphyrinogen decarboxylase family protein [Desulfobacteraceae bacterium]
MNHRERVQTALAHEVPDRCPMQVSFTPEFARRLQHIYPTTKTLHNPHGGGNTYELERALDEDMLLTSVGWANSYYASDEDTYVDEWQVEFRNVRYQTKFGIGHYTEMVGHPLAEDDAIDSYRPPDPNRPELYTEAEWMIDQFQKDYWIVGVTVTTMFETAWALRGYEKTLMDLVLDHDYVKKLFEIPFAYHHTAAKKLVELGVDMIWIGDDVGCQDQMLISPDTWRHLFKPYMATFISSLKDINPDVKIAYHSDGVINQIIPDLIDIGLDVLNPIQPQCMDPAQIKKQYGANLCFWGTIDEQHTLPFGTPEDVKNEVITRLKTIGNSGGLIIGPTHHIQLDTPLENFQAMVNTIVNTPYSLL